jgi:hypothetical protein
VTVANFGRQHQRSTRDLWTPISRGLENVCFCLEL